MTASRVAWPESGNAQSVNCKALAEMGVALHPMHISQAIAPKRTYQAVRARVSYTYTVYGKAQQASITDEDMLVAVLLSCMGWQTRCSHLQQ